MGAKAIGSGRRKEGMGVSGKKEIELVKMWCSHSVRVRLVLPPPMPMPFFPTFASDYLSRVATSANP